MRNIWILFPFIWFFFSFTKKEKPSHNVIIIESKNDNNRNIKLDHKSDKPVFILKVPRTKSMPKVFITNSDITKIPVVKLQKSDSIIMVKELLGDLRQDNSDNSTTSTYSTTFLLVGVLLFLLLFIVFRIKKRKKQHVQYPSEQQHQEEENTALIDSAEEEIDLSTDIEIISPENNELYSKLVLFYQDERPYLNANLKVIDVAKALNISPRTITAILKANGFNGFNNFNNKYRVEEVIRQFNDPNYLSIKMEAISSNAGFGNRQTFYNAFEEFTGFNPGYYRSEYLKQ